MGKISGSGSGMNNADHISERLETIFWVKILKFFDADPGWKKFGSGIKDKHHGIPIRDKHFGSATLVSDIEKLFQKCISSLTSNKDF